MAGGMKFFALVSAERMAGKATPPASFNKLYVSVVKLESIRLQRFAALRANATTISTQVVITRDAMTQCGAIGMAHVTREFDQAKTNYDNY